MVITTNEAHHVTVRRLGPEDRKAATDVYERLTERDAYLRFFGSRPKKLGKLIGSLCLQDEGHCAVGAFVDGRMLGVANYVPPAGTVGVPVEVEFAIVVDHDEQLHGIGTLLLTRLTDEARRHGIQQLRAEMLAENTVVLQLLRDLGWSEALRREGSHICLDLRLQDESTAVDELTDRGTTA
ncbi:MAG: GNAT family N-acetyltransferase [Rhodococcus sp. (in: high G+C Gram-positive bacteria)]|uniref:GNAT family N-acetyltransferase n=1 Tax=Rhodococcus sp. TaxID=1831 RepID=UPI003BB03663